MTKSLEPYVGSVVTRPAARKLGLKRYFTGKPCKYGHIDQRLVTTKKCSSCARLESKARREKNPEDVARRNAKWSAANPERKRQLGMAWRLANPEKQRALNARWRAANSKVTAAHSRNRRALTANAIGYHDPSEVTRLFHAQGGKCAYCKTPIDDGYHADHVISITRGGTNWIENIALACAACNIRKKDKDPAIFAQEMGIDIDHLIARALAGPAVQKELLLL